MLEQLVIAFGYRTGDNQRSTCVVNQYRVDLIDDGIIVLTLYKVFRADSHVVTQVVETEFIVCTKSDICQICLTTCVGVRLMTVDTIYAQTVEHIKRTHPFGVTFGEVIIHGNYVYAVSGQCVEEYRECSHQCFTFTGCHFRNLTFMQNDTTKELYIVVNHVPQCVVTTGYPVILIDGLVAFDAYEIFCSSQLTVEVGSSYNDFFIFCKTFGSSLYDRKSNRQYFVQCFFIFFQNFFFCLIDLYEDFFAVFQFESFNACLQLFHFRTFSSSRFMDIFFEFFRFGTEGVVV